ncbi:MAG: hypothetical protein HC933_15615 [Pleurocapsa sp. SU_196_0]|nr:hypothetical protein [Pleurocapsa sp. SU_196_0]
MSKKNEMSDAEMGQNSSDEANWEARAMQENEPARPDGSGAFRDHTTDDDGAPISAWLREFFGRPEVQRFMQDTKQSAEKAGIDMNKVQDVAQDAKKSAQGWLEKLESQAREKPLQTLAMVFGAGLLLSRVGRGRR